MKNTKIITILIVCLMLVIGGLFFASVNGRELLRSKEIVGNSKLDSNQILDSSSFIEQLKARKFEEGEITIEQKVSSNDYYASYIFSYKSDGLKIFGMMNVPAGNGPFPVIILNHGYYNLSQFQSGDGTKTIADILAKEGYLTLASDYRGHGQSENDGEGSRGHNPNYTIDVLSLIASIHTLPKADENKIGMWGHSMGGEVSLRTAEATDKIKAIVLWAPTSGRTSDNASFYGGRTQLNQSSDDGGTSPIDYLRYIQSPISLHQGLSDTEVNPDWSKELNNALRKEGKIVEYFEYPGQDHNFKNLGWDLIAERTIIFYDQYLK